MVRHAREASRHPHVVTCISTITSAYAFCSPLQVVCGKRTQKT